MTKGKEREMRQNTVDSNRQDGFKNQLGPSKQPVPPFFPRFHHLNMCLATDRPCFFFYKKFKIYIFLKKKLF